MSDKFSEKHKRLVFLCYTTTAAKGHTWTIWNIIGGLLEFLNVFIVGNLNRTILMFLSKTLPPSSFTKVSLKEEFHWTSAIYHDAPNNSNLLLPWSNKYLQSHKCVTRISTIINVFPIQSARQLSIIKEITEVNFINKQVHILCVYLFE